jgi:hypothetical protein
MKSSITFFLFISLLVFSAPAPGWAGQKKADFDFSTGFPAASSITHTEYDNPIDRAFVKDFDGSLCLADMSNDMEEYKNVWRAEMLHCASLFQKEYKYSVDKKRMNSYLSATEKSARLAYKLGYMTWQGVEDAPSERFRDHNTGSEYNGLRPEAKVYRAAALNLIQLYSHTHTYRYLYSPNPPKNGRAK